MAIVDMEFHEIRKAKLALCALSVYRNILNYKVADNLYKLLDKLESGNNDLQAVINLYNDFFHMLVSFNSTCSLKSYIIEKIIVDENPFSLVSEACGFQSINSVLRNSAANDLNCHQTVSELSPLKIKTFIIKCLSSSRYEAEIVEKLPAWNSGEIGNSDDMAKAQDWPAIMKLFYSSSSWGDCIEALASFYGKNGCGAFTRYKAFIWENTGASGHIRGVDHPDPVRLSDLVGYEAERSDIINNTLQFLQGCPANNVLLYGDRGTGKSTTVKALLNEFHTQGLRILEVPKKHLVDFPEIIRQLRNRHLKFIVFVDDLAFEDNEENYTALKAVLEGSIESRPANVLIYATSNRRHLVKEKFSDRAGLSSIHPEDEVRAADTIQEKLSLSDRFGITVVFSSPDKSKYLEIVEGLVDKRGLCIDRETLHKEALKWELWYNGRSPRTARQFVDWLEGELKLKK